MNNFKRNFKQDNIKPEQKNENEDVLVGRNPILEALKSGRGIDKILVAKGEREGSVLKIIALAKEKGIPVADTDRLALNKLSAFSSHQGVAAFVTAKEYSTVEDILALAAAKNEKPFIVISDGINDPHNLGAIIRTADACGVHGVIIPKRHNVGMTTAVYSSSAGAAEYVKVAKVSNIAQTIDDLKKKGIWIYGTDLKGDTLYFDADFNCPCAIVIGGEGEGMGRLNSEKCDYLLKIPMKGKVSSLNASAAGAVILYEVLKQRLIK